MIYLYFIKVVTFRPSIGDAVEAKALLSHEAPNRPRIFNGCQFQDVIDAVSRRQTTEVVEITFHIPPPFRFSLQYDRTRSATWQQNYSVSQLNPASGCSLSFAIDKFRPFG